MYCYITAIRDVLLWQQVPTVSIMVRCVLFAACALVIGYLVFHKNEHKFILYI